jgi:Family of unknown function (DUF5522)
MSGNDSSKPKEPTAPREDEDYYYEGPYMVFTERYHLKRGTCCGSGCRHCPYKGKRSLTDSDTD